MNKLKLLAAVIWHACLAKVKALKISGTHVPFPWKMLFHLLLHELWNFIKDSRKEKGD